MNILIVIYLGNFQVYYTTVKYNIYYGSDRRFNKIGHSIIINDYLCPIEKLVEIL